MVATGHFTVCTTLGTDAEYYVYVHKATDADSWRSLAFRFAPAFGVPDTCAPEMTWVDGSTLRISVGHISEVSKQVNSIDGVNISYSIGQEAFPLEDWDRSVKETKAFAVCMFLLLLVLIRLCALLVKSIIHQKKRVNLQRV